MANEALLNLGTELILESSSASTTLDDGDIVECNSDDRQPGDNTGYPLGIFEFSTLNTTGFSAAPTAGALVNLYEQKINSDGNDSPDVDANYKADYLGTFTVDVSSGPQNMSLLAPIHRYGGKYWLEWLDGGAGTAQVEGGWALRLIPATYGT